MALRAAPSASAGTVYASIAAARLPARGSKAVLEFVRIKGRSTAKSGGKNQKERFMCVSSLRRDDRDVLDRATGKEVEARPGRIDDQVVVAVDRIDAAAVRIGRTE